MPFDSVSAQMILLKCQGDEIWDLDTCRSVGVPEGWIDELLDRFESGFDFDRNTIYCDQKMVNQYEGVSDLHLAYKLAEYLGIDWEKAKSSAISRRGIVAAIKAELDEI